MSKRVTHLVLATFVLQIVAAGFCATLVEAAPKNQLLTASHCGTSTMQTAHSNMSSMSDMGKHDEVKEHACAHCDLPDVNISLDKQAFVADDLSADFVIVAIVATIADTQARIFDVRPPDLRFSQTSLSSFNLNLRLRV